MVLWPPFWGSPRTDVPPLKNRKQKKPALL